MPAKDAKNAKREQGKDLISELWSLPHRGATPLQQLARISHMLFTPKPKGLPRSRRGKSLAQAAVAALWRALGV
jgi:hypothetical protein